jgi:hypothetical protein
MPDDGSSVDYTERLLPPAPLQRLLSAAPWLCQWQSTFILYAVLALVASIVLLFRLRLNDFDIVRQSFTRLLNGKLPYPLE